MAMLGENSEKARRNQHGWSELCFLLVTSSGGMIKEATCMTGGCFIHTQK
jgi:hypothetical protein